MEVAAGVVLFFLIYASCWALLGPLAESKGYMVTWQRAIPVLNSVAVLAFLITPRRSPKRRHFSPEQQKKMIRVTRPDAHGRYRGR